MLRVKSALRHIPRSAPVSMVMIRTSSFRFCWGSAHREDGSGFAGQGVAFVAGPEHGQPAPWSGGQDRVQHLCRHFDRISAALADVQARVPAEQACKGAKGRSGAANSGS